MTREDCIQHLLASLGEAEQKPREQLAAVVDVLGMEAALELLRETQAIEGAGGMLTGDGLRRRTPGGVYFALARKRLSRKERRAIFGPESGAPRSDAPGSAPISSEARPVPQAERDAPPSSRSSDRLVEVIRTRPRMVVGERSSPLTAEPHVFGGDPRPATLPPPTARSAPLTPVQPAARVLSEPLPEPEPDSERAPESETSLKRRRIVVARAITEAAVVSPEPKRRGRASRAEAAEPSPVERAPRRTPKAPPTPVPRGKPRQVDVSVLAGVDGAVEHATRAFADDVLELLRDNAKQQLRQRFDRRR